MSTTEWLWYTLTSIRVVYVYTFQVMACSYKYSADVLGFTPRQILTSRISLISSSFLKGERKTQYALIVNTCHWHKSMSGMTPFPP